MWKKIKEFLPSKKSSSTVNLSMDRTTISDKVDVANAFNTFFCNIGSEIGKTFDDSLPKVDSFVSGNRYVIPSITPDFVLTEIKQMAAGKATGIDGISVKLLKLADGEDFSTGYIPVVAFTQGQTAHMNLTQGEILNYNKLITNIHSVIDANGVFTANTAGLYAFHFYSLTKVNTELWLEIMLNGNLVASAYAHSSGTGGYADAGNSVILELSRGDMVYIKAHDQYQNIMFGTRDQIYTTFTGVMIDSGYFEHESLNRNNPTGFSVGLDHHQTITNGSNIPFDVDIMNRSREAGYNFTTHEFVSPHEGLYIFHFHALSEANNKIWIELFNNDQYVVAAYAFTSNEYGDAGNTAILHLMQNDHVTVKARPGNDVEMFGSPTGVYATFSGALLSLSLPRTETPETDFEEMAFTVGLTRDANVPAYSKVPFDRLYTNFGNGFDMNRDVFTAKIHGVYIFQFHGLSQNGQVLYLDLYHNYKYITSAYAFDANSFSAGSNTAALTLMAGDEVYVSVRGTSKLFGSHDEVYCTFSGYLVAPLNQYQPIVG
ncbi:uncharacterized protein LOC132559737 [Ylistrum balloti]|uniref:uncharacterized protein LOC132559737 n=1 Tax=Ylistrum balloti TaxID=509963 RepID=UPI0029059E33|nr:uncharacterized protein LOC132559737 [Ylistrum balloti]